MDIFVAFASLIIISILAKLILEKKNRRFYQLLKQFPSYTSYPLIGNLLLLSNPKDGLLEKLEKITQPYDRVVFWFGPMPVLILKRYDDIAKILSQCQDRDYLGKSDEWVGVGLLTARYKEWKTSRRILSPAFTSQMLSKYLQVFNKNASIFAENLKSVADTGEQVDVYDWVMKGSLDSILENAMGVSIRGNEKSEQDFCKAVHSMLISILQRVQFPWLFPDIIYKLYLKITREVRAVEHLNFLPAQILRKKMNEFQDTQRQNIAVDDANSSRTVIDLLIKKSLTEPDITETRMKNELLQIIGAGIETTALGMSFLLLMLAMNQDTQQKVYEEVVQLPASNDEINGEVDENNLSNHLGYLEQCIKETLRMFSPAVFSIRRTNKEISLDDKIVPENFLVWTHIYAANKDPKLYKNPLKWDPEHFNEEAVKERPKVSELMFGYGPRSCIGAKYAMMNIKTQVVHIIRKYHLSTDVKELTVKDLSMDISIRSKFGYPVKFTTRQQAKT